MRIQAIKQEDLTPPIRTQPYLRTNERGYNTRDLFCPPGLPSHPNTYTISWEYMRKGEEQRNRKTRVYLKLQAGFPSRALSRAGSDGDDLSLHYSISNLRADPIPFYSYQTPSGQRRYHPFLRTSLRNVESMQGGRKAVIKRESESTRTQQ